MSQSIACNRVRSKLTCFLLRDKGIRAVHRLPRLTWCAVACASEGKEVGKDRMRIARRYSSGTSHEATP